MKAVIKRGALVGQDMGYFKWDSNLSGDIIFEIHPLFDSPIRKKCIAPGFGHLRKGYGNGAIYADKKDLIFIDPSQEEHIIVDLEECDPVHDGFEWGYY